jgi:transcriptional regulator with XRE-family HTH domain
MADFAHMNLEPISIKTSSEALIEAKFIGRKIRSLRVKRSIGLAELGRRAGLSPSFLSQLETGRVVPTLRNLACISLVFGKDLSYFFREERQNFFRISRAKERTRISVKEKSAPFFVSESLSALIPDLSLVPNVTDFLPGSDAGLDPQQFMGLECVYVIHGCLATFINGERSVLEVADVLWIDGSAKREYRCHGDTPTKGLIISIPNLSMRQLHITTPNLARKGAKIACLKVRKAVVGPFVAEIAGKLRDEYPGMIQDM